MDRIFHMIITIWFVNSVTVDTVESECRDGWIKHNDSCYLLSKSISDWAGAGYICSKFGGKLIEIETTEEDNFIQSKLQALNSQVSYWNGMSDIEVEGAFRWIDSDTTLTYTNWHPGQPENAPTQNCGILWKDTGYDWHDFHCEQAEHFICEMEAEVNGGEIIGK